MVGGLCTTKLTLTHGRSWNDTFGTLGYNRPNSLNKYGYAKDFNTLESIAKDKGNLYDKVILKYKTILKQKGFYSGTELTGKITDSLKRAVKDFVEFYNSTKDKSKSEISYDENDLFNEGVVKALLGLD